MNALDAAKAARRAAERLKPGNPLRFAAYRYVTNCERDLSDDEYAAYREWQGTERP